MKLKTLMLVASILLIFQVNMVVFVHAQSTTFTISQGIYPHATSFTLWKESSTYYAKTNYGVIAYSGTDATTILQSVSGACSSGGAIYLSLDEYIVSGTIPYYSDQVWIGETHSDDVGGTGTTIKRTTDAPIFNATASSVRQVRFKHLTFEGQGKGQGTTPLVQLWTLSGDVLFDSCTFMYSGGAGVELSVTSYWTTLINCQATSLTGALVYRTSPASTTTLVMLNCLSTYGGALADLYGIRGLTIQGGGGDHWDAYGLKLQLCIGTVQGLDIEGDAGGTNGHGIWLISGGIHLAGNNVEDFGNDTGAFYPIFLSTYGYGSIIESNYVQTSVSSYSLRFASDAEWYLVQKNSFDKPVYGYAGRTTCKCQYNINYQTVACGVAEVSNDDWITLPYTFAGTPNIVFLTVQESDAQYFAQVKSASTTQIQIYLYDHTAGALEDTDMTISWYAEYKP